MQPVCQEALVFVSSGGSMSLYALCKAEATCIGQLADYVRQQPFKAEASKDRAQLHFCCLEQKVRFPSASAWEAHQLHKPSDLPWESSSTRSLKR